MVALGYSKIPGVDYTDNFAPVAHDVSFRIALARMMVEKLGSLVIDVETAFLYGDIEEEIFMKSPEGMGEIDPGSSPEDCYQLQNGIYGLCQAARQFWKKFVDTIKKEPFGFTVSPADLGIIFEFTAPGTPQQNSVDERKIPTSMGRSRAMMITAGFSQQDEGKL